MAKRDGHFALLVFLALTLIPVTNALPNYIAYATPFYDYNDSEHLVRFNITTRNDGTSSSSPSSTFVYFDWSPDDNGWPYGWEAHLPIQPLPAGSLSTTQLAYGCYPHHAVTLNLSADERYEVPESDENDNYAYYNFACPPNYPDLVITAITFPRTSSVGALASVNVTVRNAGNFYSPGVTLELTSRVNNTDPPGIPDFYASYGTPLLQPGQAATIHFTVPLCQRLGKQAFPVRAIVDWGNGGWGTVWELNETNDELVRHAGIFCNYAIDAIPGNSAVENQRSYG